MNAGPKFPIPNVNSICFKHICQWLGLSVLLCRALQLLAVNIIKFISNRLYYLPNHHPLELVDESQKYVLIGSD